MSFILGLNNFPIEIIYSYNVLLLLSTWNVFLK